MPRFSKTGAAVSLILVLFIVSCAKRKDCYATIICLDSAGLVMDSVAVELYSYVKSTDGSAQGGQLKASGLTDESGKISFNFTHPAMFTIKAEKGAKQVTGNIRLQEGKEVQQTLTFP